MKWLIESGADPSWTETKDQVVHEAKILDWCAYPLYRQSRFTYAFCQADRRHYEYPLYATEQQIEDYKKENSFGYNGVRRK